MLLAKHFADLSGQPLTEDTSVQLVCRKYPLYLANLTGFVPQMGFDLLLKLPKLDPKNMEHLVKTVTQNPHEALAYLVLLHFTDDENIILGAIGHRESEISEKALERLSQLKLNPKLIREFTEKARQHQPLYIRIVNLISDQIESPADILRALDISHDQINQKMKNKLEKTSIPQRDLRQMIQDNVPVTRDPQLLEIAALKLKKEYGDNLSLLAQHPHNVFCAQIILENSNQISEIIPYLVHPDADIKKLAFERIKKETLAQKDFLQILDLFDKSKNYDWIDVLKWAGTVSNHFDVLFGILKLNIRVLTKVVKPRLMTLPFSLNQIQQMKTLEIEKIDAELYEYARRIDNEAFERERTSYSAVFKRFLGIR